MGNVYAGYGELSHDEARDLIQEVAEEYLEAFKPAYSTLQDLNELQRRELFELLSHQLGRPMNREALFALENRSDIQIDDILEVFLAE